MPRIDSLNLFSDYIGNPLQGCRRECDSNRDCTQAQECVQFKCVAACREGGKNLSFLQVISFNKTQEGQIDD